MPRSIQRLVRKCWASEPDDRPEDFSVVEHKLLEIEGRINDRLSTGVANDVGLSKAREARALVLEGLEEGAPQYACTGRYVLMEGKVVNGRGVWRQERCGAGARVAGAVKEVGAEEEGGGSEGGNDKEVERFLYHATYEGQDWQSVAWWVGKRETMEEGAAWGWVQVVDDGLTPAVVVGTWQVFADKADGQGEWVNSPSLRASVVTKEGAAAGGAGEQQSKDVEEEEADGDRKNHPVLGRSSRTR
jgi:hypothetical protein